MGFAMVQFVNWVLNLYWYLIIVRILLSWFPNLSQTMLGYWVRNLTEPLLGPFRRLIPPLPLGGVYIDLSVYAALIAYFFAENGILWLVRFYSACWA